MKDIVLVSLYNLEAPSVRTLHAILKNADFKITSLFFKRKEFDNSFSKYSSSEIDYLVGQIKSLDPSIVGISVMSAFFDLASLVTKKIKEQTSALVIWGGIHPTIRPEQCLDVADIVCVGEGEGPVLELAQRISKGEEINNTQNLWIKNNQGIIKNELRPLIQDLDSIPFPDYSSDNKYVIEGNNKFPCNYNDVIRHLGMYFMTSRGCPFSCTYCVNSVLRNIYKDKGKFIRQRSVDNVILELEYLKKNYNISFVHFQDEIFAIDKEWLKEFELKYKKSIGISFSCYVRAGFTKEDRLQLLKDAGCARIQIGIQSGSERIKRLYFGRTDTSEEIIGLTKAVHDLKMDCAVDILMENPLETEEDRQETLALLLKLPKPFFLNTHTLTHFPEYELTKFLLKNKLISEGDIEGTKKESFESNRWNPFLDSKRDKINMFWNCLYFLASTKSILSENFIIRLSHNRILKENPKVFLKSVLLLNTVSYYIAHPLEVSDMLRRKWIILIKGKR